MKFTVHMFKKFFNWNEDNFDEFYTENKAIVTLTARSLQK